MIVRLRLHRQAWCVFEKRIGIKNTAYLLGRKSNPEKNIMDCLWNNDVSDNSSLETHDIINCEFIGLFGLKGGNKVICFSILLLLKLNLLLEIRHFGNETTDAVHKEDIPADKTKAVHEMQVTGHAND
jgi:hypothetical protein